MFPLPITGPVLSSLETPSDIEKKEKPLSEDEILANKVDLDISEALKEHEDVSKQVDADISLIEKPIEKDAFGEVKDPITKGIESVQSGISSIIGDDKQESPFVNELSERIRTAGPNKIDQYDKDIISTLNGEEQKDLLERHPWVYPTLTKDQKDEQFKLSRESNISALGATARAVGQVGNFGLDLVKAGWNLGLDSAYAEFAAPIKDAWTGETKIDPVSLKPISPRQQLAREKVNADLRNAAGAFMNTVIETSRQIEKYTGGTGTAFSGIVPTNASVLSQSIGGSPLFLATKLAEAGKNPDSGYAAFIDGLNEQFGFQDTSMSQKHYENRKLYEAEKSAEDWNAGQGSELVSPWSKAVYNPAFQFLNLQRESWMLPNVKTYAKLKGISEDQAEIELSQQAEANAETNLRDATLKWNKEYDPSMELLGGMFMGDAALDVAGIGVGGARLIGKGFKRFETAGMSPEAINALMTARQARQREILAENIANAQKRSIAGKVAKGTEEIQGKIYEKGSEFLAPIKATYEKIPAPLRGLAQIGGLGTAGAYAGYILNPEDQEKGILKGLGTVAGTATVLGAVPGVVRSIDEARMLRAGGSQLGEGLLETAGKLPTSTTTTKILFGGKRGPVADYLADNFHTLGKAGINFAALNAINSSINSDSPEKFIDSIAEGFVMGAGFKLFGKIHGSDPEAELDARKRKDIEIYLSRQRQSDQTRENMDSLRNYQNYVDASQDNIGKMQVELEKAQQSNNPEKITTAQKAVDVAQEIHNQILSANVQTRNEMGRMMDEIYSDGNSLLNGARKVGQQNVQLEVLTTPQIIDLLSKQYPEKTADELTFMANQRGFFMPEKNASIVNFDKIIKRQYLFGESLTEAFRHELGHATWSIKEFRDLNKTTDELLFDQVQRNLNGEILDTKPGKFSEDDLFELYSGKYLKNKTQEEIDQYAKESGLWDYNTNALNRTAVIDYMKDEVRAELVSGNLSQGYGKMKNQSRSIDDWVSLRNKTNLLARAMQNALGIGAKPFQSKLLGVKYDPEIVAANRKAIESLRKYNGEFEDAPESKKGQDIPEKVMRNDPVMRKRYGLNGGEYQTTLYAEVRDADGNVVGKRVPVTSENVKEGTWSNDATTGETKRTRGYGNVPEEFAQVEIPSGGSLNIVTDFAVESDGKTPIRRSDKDIEELNENRRIAIKEAIDLAGDRYTDPRWMKAYSEDGESYDGLFSPEQIRNIKNLPESVLPLSIKEKIIALNNIMLMNDGSTVEFDYAPRLKGKKYKGRRSEIYSLILGGKFHLSKATNFGVNAVSRGAWKRKLNARKDRMPNWFSPWGNDTGLFEKEMQEVYLQNTYDKKPGWYGLDPENPTEKTPLAEEKWNKFKDFLNMVSKDMPTPENPWRMKTPSAKGKEGKAQGDIDNLWRQFRLDAIADWADSTDATGRYKMGWENIYKQLLPIDESGEPIDSKTPDQQKRKGISTNFMPEDPIEATERYPTSERGMYSGLQKTIDEKVQGKFASPDQLKAIVTNPQNAKAEELKWSGVLGEIDRLATENSGKVPKDKVMDYLRNEGAVKFEEVTLGGKEAFDQNRLNQLEAEYRNLKDHPIDDPSFGEDKYDELIKLMNIRDQSTTDTLYSEAERVMALAQQAQRRGDKKTAEKYFRENEFLNTRAEKLDLQGQGLTNPPRFAGLQLPGGTNYREVVMTMPRAEESKFLTKSELNEYEKLRFETDNRTPEQQARLDQLLIRISENNAASRDDKSYTSSHFPDTPNYVAHMRLNERTDAQGNEGLFVEELQSDRHQAGREKGYKGEVGTVTIEKVGNIGWTAIRKNPDGSSTNLLIDVGGYYPKKESVEAEIKRMGDEGIPDAPFRKDWSIQLFKRALRDAVDADKKWIGWTTGIEQVKRYEQAMRQAVDEITWNTPKGYQKSFSAIKNGNTVLAGKINDDGSVYDSDTADANGKQLSEVLGKEVASKILAENSGTATGDDLTVGGEGMKGFYDQILPKEIGKYVAKMGGKVEKSEIGQEITEDDLDMGDLSDATPQELAELEETGKVVGNTVPIWRVDITPEMAGKVRGGQLQFMPADSDYLNLAKDPEKNREQLQRMVDVAAKGAGYNVGIAEHRTRSSEIEGNKFDLNKAGSVGGVNTTFYRPAIWFAIPSEKTRDVMKTLESKGFPPPYGSKIVKSYLKIEEGVDYDHTEKSGTRILAVTDPSRIKSADPVTYDDNGNAVPLSQRFNPKTSDIRFMPAEQPTEYEPISARIRPLQGISAPTKMVGAKALSLGEIEPPVRGKAMLPDMELGTTESDDKLTKLKEFAPKTEDKEGYIGVKSIGNREGQLKFADLLDSNVEQTKNNLIFLKKRLEQEKNSREKELYRDKIRFNNDLIQQFGDASKTIRYLDSNNIPFQIDNSLRTGSVYIKTGTKDFRFSSHSQTPYGFKTLNGFDDVLSHFEPILTPDISEKGIQSSDITTSAKPAPDAVIKPFSNALVSSAGLINFLPAFHGTPFDVDKFKLEKIGTGEGAQAYGWGLYFAQARSVGEQYRDALAKFGTKKDPWFAYQVRADLAKGDDWNTAFQKTYSEASDKVKKTMDAWTGPNDVVEPKGNLYKVDLDVKDEDLLDWDKPLNKQSEKIRENVLSESKLLGDLNREWNGQDLYKNLVDEYGGEKQASEYLNSIGIPGIRYLDGTSRKQGEGTYNYVVFDENLITILDKNDKPVQGELPRATGLQFMPARPIGKTEPLPDFETTIIKGVTPAKGFKWDKATNVEIDIGGGRKMSFSYDPEYLEVPKFKDLIKELKGQPVILLEADRQRATGGDMGGPLHPFLKSNQVTITGPDGKKYKAVWANMTSTFVSGAKNRLASHGAKYALVHLMDPIAHKSNKRTARTLDKMMRKSKLSQREKEIISLSMQAGIIAGEKSAMSSAITALKRQMSSAKKDPEKIRIINEKINKITKEREDITPKGFYREIFKAVSNIKTAISNVKSGNWAENTIEKAKKNLEKYVNIKEYNELLKNNKSLYISDNIGNTFSNRGSAIGSILSFKFGKFDPSLVMRESSDFREGENLDIVTAVELSQNPDIFALYFGKDPKEEAAMSPAELKARDEMRANPDFVEHEAYDWVMLGPEKGNNFLVKNPVKPEQIFKKYRETHAGETVVDGSAETVAGAMRKNAGFILRVDEDTQKVLASKKKNK